MNKQKIFLLISLVALFLFTLFNLSACKEQINIALDKEIISLTVGESAILTATVSLEESVEWESTDESVVTVKDGTVSAVSAGQAKIIASVEDKTATCVVFVLPDSNISLDLKALTLDVNQTKTITATVSGQNIRVEWKSSDPTVATVFGGVVSAFKAGNTIITASIGDKSATCVVTVKAVPSITLDENLVILTPQQTKALTPTISGENVTVEWTSLDPTIAIVENGVITAVSQGQTVISASIGEKSAICTVVVFPSPIINPDNENTDSLPPTDSQPDDTPPDDTPPDETQPDETQPDDPQPEPTPIPQITLNTDNLQLQVGQTHTLIATVINAQTAVCWDSSDPIIATVEGGVINAIKEGQTIITATVGEIIAQCIVNVTPTPNIWISKGGMLNFDSISLNKSFIINDNGNIITKTISANTHSFDLYDTIIKYRTDNGITQDKAYTVIISAGSINKTLTTATLCAISDLKTLRNAVDRENERTDNLYYYLTADIEIIQTGAGYGSGYQVLGSGQNANKSANDPAISQPAKAYLNLDGRGYSFNMEIFSDDSGERWMFDYIVDSNIKNLAVNYNVKFAVIEKATFANRIINTNFSNCYFNISVKCNHQTLKSDKFFANAINNSNFNSCIFNLTDSSLNADEYPLRLSHDTQYSQYNHCALLYNRQTEKDNLFITSPQKADINLYTNSSELIEKERKNSWDSAWTFNSLSRIITLCGKVIKI